MYDAPTRLQKTPPFHGKERLQLHRIALRSHWLQSAKPFTQKSEIEVCGINALSWLTGSPSNGTNSLNLSAISKRLWPAPCSTATNCINPEFSDLVWMGILISISTDVGRHIRVLPLPFEIA
jgi:hypothetical protein